MRRPSTRTLALTVAGALALATAGVGTWAVAGPSTEDRYRWVAAAYADVTDAAVLTGTVRSAERSEVAFASAGTVQTVDVSAGDTVRAGRVLASLDRTTLRRELRAAQAEVATARATLQRHRAGQAQLVQMASAGGGSATPGMAATMSVALARLSAVDDALADLAAQQQAVIDAQGVVSRARASASEKLSAQQSACGAAYAHNSAQDAALDEACDTALGTVQAAQAEVATAQDQLAGALDTLHDTLQRAIEAVQAAAQDGGEDDSTPRPEPTDPAPTNPAPTNPAPTNPDPAAPDSGGTESDTITATQLAQDAAAVDAALAIRQAAREALDGSVVRAPWAGTVADVGVAVGEAVSAGTSAATLLAPGETVVDVEATLTQVRSLAVGQRAHATAAGGSQSTDAKVVRVSTDPAGGDTYAVTLRLAGGSVIADGVPATVTVEVGSATDVLTVPTSALSEGTVTVLTADGTEQRRVVTGLQGDRRTQVTDGLVAGDRVVLADLEAALDNSATSGERDWASRPPG